MNLPSFLFGFVQETEMLLTYLESAISEGYQIKMKDLLLDRDNLRLLASLQESLVRVTC